LTLKGRLGSTVFVSTDVFLDLVLNQPCFSCLDIDPKNQKAQIKVDGLQIHITLTCSLCSSETEYCNEREGDNFSKSIASAGLLGGVNREEVQSILALLGVTKQSGHQQYFNKQAEFFQSLYQIADKSAENLLILVCEQLRNNNQDILEVSFDCAWSHVREAMQASGAFIFNGELEVDGDLSINKTLLNMVNQIFMNLKHKAKTIRSKIESDRNWKIFEKPIMSFYTKCIYAASSRANNPKVSTPTDEELAWILPSPNLIGTDENQCKQLLEFLKKITKLKENQSLITTIRTSYNEAFNRLKLNYVEKKTDYPKSFRAQHALSIIHNNEDEKNLLNIWKYKNRKRENNIATIQTRNKKRAEKIINQKCQLESFNFSQVNFIACIKELTNSRFEPSFASLVSIFKSSSLKCIACQSFQKKFQPTFIPSLESNIVNSIIIEFFEFEEYYEKQRERLTVVFTPQKALIDDQREIVGMGIPAAMLYASSEQPPFIQKKIFAEIASGLICVLFVTPEKYTKNSKFRIMLQNIYNTQGLQFVIDKAHCIVLYKGFRNAWKNLGTLKHDFPAVPVLALMATCSFTDAKIIQSVLEKSNMEIIRTSTIQRPEIILEVRPKPAAKDKLYQTIFSLLDNLEGRAIIYGATVKECDDMTKALCKNFDPTIVGMYHGKQASAEQTAVSAGWKNKTIKIISATTAFGMGINVDDVTLVIHTTLPMSHEQYIQEIGRAGRIEDKKSKNLDMKFQPNDTQIPACHICDNCKEREKDAPDMCDVIVEALQLVKIVLQHAIIRSNNMHYVTREDVVDVFYRSKNNNVTKKNLMHISEYSGYVQTRLHPKKMCFYLLDSLIQKKVIIQVTDLQRIRPKSSILTCTYKIIGVCENTESIVSSEVWQLYLK
ncbi:16740_t:CDS:10, partial [Gigaspora rosea]